jgi:hypothetical protein
VRVRVIKFHQEHDSAATVPKRLRSIVAIMGIESMLPGGHIDKESMSAIRMTYRFARAFELESQLRQFERQFEEELGAYVVESVESSGRIVEAMRAVAYEGRSRLALSRGELVIGVLLLGSLLLVVATGFVGDRFLLVTGIFIGFMLHVVAQDQAVRRVFSFMSRKLVDFVSVVNLKGREERPGDSE